MNVVSSQYNIVPIIFIWYSVQFYLFVCFICEFYAVCSGIAEPVYSVDWNEWAE